MCDSKNGSTTEPATTAEVVNGISRGLRRLVRPGQVTELRALTCRGGTVSGYFDHAHLPDMAAAAAALERAADGVYLIPNAIRRGRLATRPYVTARAGAGDTTRSIHIVERRMLLIDIDPVRPGVVSATESERAQANRLAGRVWKHLDGLGWPAPLVADSGNGIHMIYRVQLPADDGGLVRRVLHALAARFDTAACKIDRAVHDPARLVKIPGTLARKGAPTADRPHRRSSLLYPGSGKTVAVKMLESIAAEVAPPRSAVLAVPAAGSAAIMVSRVNRITRARKYLAALPPAVSGNGGHNATFRAACAAVVGFGLTPDEARPLLVDYSARCLPPWSEKELEHSKRPVGRRLAS